MNCSSTAPDPNLKAKRISKGESLVHKKKRTGISRTNAPDNKMEGEFIRIP